jgi:SAV_6107-like HEPN
VELPASSTSIPRPSRTGHAVVDLIDQSHACLAEAASAGTAAQRYAAAHLAALRAGAAVLAVRARSDPAGSRRSRGRGPRSVWAVLADVAPELGEWAGYFAAGAGKRAAAEAGLPHAVTAREADDLLRDAEAFLALVCATVEMPFQQPLAGIAALLAG